MSSTIMFFFSVRERAEFNKSCNLIGSGSGRNFPVRAESTFITKCFNFVWKLLKWPLLLRRWKSCGETSFVNLDYLCFHYYLLARNCSVCRESCHDYSPKMFGSFARLSLCCRKKIVIHQPRSVRIGKKLCPLSWVSKTSGTVFPNTDLPVGE